MKKLMVALVAVAMAVVSQAAVVQWTVTNVTKDGTALTSGSSYVFFCDSAAAAQAQILAITELAGSGASAFETAMASAAWNGTKKATAAGAFSVGTAAANGGITLTNGDLELAGNTKYYAFSVIFDTESITDESKYLIAQGTATKNGVTTKDNASSQAATFGIGSQSANTNWMAVGAPEPTSGLLLLLGMAGLALKRKQA